MDTGRQSCFLPQPPQFRPPCPAGLNSFCIRPDHLRNLQSLTNHRLPRDRWNHADVYTVPVSAPPLTLNLFLAKQRKQQSLNLDLETDGLEIVPPQLPDVSPQPDDYPIANVLSDIPGIPHPPIISSLYFNSSPTKLPPTMKIKEEDISSSYLMAPAVGSSFSEASSSRSNTSLMVDPTAPIMRANVRAPQHPQRPAPSLVSTSSSYKSSLLATGFDFPGVFGVWPDYRYHRRIQRSINAVRSTWSDAFVLFDQSIWDHLVNHLQNDATYHWKMQRKKKIESAINQIFPAEMKPLLVPVGSTVNGCGAYNSDMDLCLCLSEPGPRIVCNMDRRFAIKMLSKIRKHLYKGTFEDVTKFEMIPARVPIIKILFKMSTNSQSLEVDLNVNNVAGVYNSYLLHYYSRIDDKFPALCLLVKHWARRAGVNDAAMGTLNSYSLILMVLHFLQCGTSPPVLPNLQALYRDFFSYGSSLDDLKLFGELPNPIPAAPENEQSIGELLLCFFDYYARFDFSSQAISVQRGRTFSRHLLAMNTRRYFIYIEEPFDFQNTARCVTRLPEFELIKQRFLEARDAMLRTDRPPSLANIGVLPFDPEAVPDFDPNVILLESSGSDDCDRTSNSHGHSADAVVNKRPGYRRRKHGRGCGLQQAQHGQKKKKKPNNDNNNENCTQIKLCKLAGAEAVCSNPVVDPSLVLPREKHKERQCELKCQKKKHMATLNIFKRVKLATPGNKKSRKHAKKNKKPQNDQQQQNKE